MRRPNKRGKMAWRGTRKIGRQAQTIETFISIELHTVLPEVVQLTSLFLPPVFNVVIRTMDVAVAKIPTKKISARPIRCLRVICNFAMTGTGSAITRISVRTLKVALAKKNDCRLIQVPFICFSHDFLTGVHSNTVRMIAMT